MKATHQPKVYDLLNYDLVHIVLKPNSSIIANYETLVKFDSIKKKHYLSGKLIKKERVNLNTSSIMKHPKFRTIALVPLNHYELYTKAIKDEVKEQYIINIHFACIDCILLPFDDFDWKK